MDSNTILTTYVSRAAHGTPCPPSKSPMPKADSSAPRLSSHHDVRRVLVLGDAAVRDDAGIQLDATGILPEPDAGPATPDPVRQRTYPAVPQSPDERDRRLRTPSRTPSWVVDHPPQQPAAGVAAAARQPLGRTLSKMSGPKPGLDQEVDLEMSRPTTPATSGGGAGGGGGGRVNGADADAGPDDGVEALQSLWDPWMNRFRMASACLNNFCNGLNDSAPGALIPYMEAHYDIGYAVVSLVFVGNAFGFIFAALFLDSFRERLGRAKTLAVAQGIIAIGYLPIVVAAPFAAVVVAFFLVGFGMSLNIALGNTFCNLLRNGTSMLGFLHGCYGVGGTIGPLIATALVTVARQPWQRYYLLTMGLALASLALAAWAFRGFEHEQALRELQLQAGVPLAAVAPQSAAAAAATAAATPRPPEPTLAGAGASASSSSSLPDSTPQTPTRLILAAPPAAPRPLYSGGAASAARAAATSMFSAIQQRVVLLGALFIFAYQGAEVSISGWVTSFLIAARGGDPSRVGYVTAGFWGGITLGRFLLSGPAARRFGERRFVYAIVVGAAALQLLVWLVPDVVGDAVAVALVGLLLGPVYPCAAALFMRGMTRREQMSGLGVISAFGSSGGAVAPFTTGLLAQAVGTFVLHPICIGLFAVMLGCWTGLPRQRKRSD